MIECVTGLFLVFTLTWYLAPRTFRIADIYEARRQINPDARTVVVQPDTHASVSSSRKHTSTVLDFANLCDSLARATRSGMAAHDAILMNVQQHYFPHPCWKRLQDDLVAMHSCDSALANARKSASPRSHDAQCLSLIESAFVLGNFVPNALDHAATVLRDRASCQAELAVAASQAQLSARLLSALPFILLSGAVLLIPQFRSGITSPIVLVFLCIGVMLNRIGWRWISSLIARAIRGEPDDIGELTEHLCVSLRAGLPMIHACERWRGVSATGNSIADFIETGTPLEEALLPLAVAHQITGKNLGRTIVEAERDGLPIMETVTRLAADHRAEQRRQIDTRIRQLPTRLSLPLVFCVLPSFLLLSVAPLVFASLGQLSISLPSLTY